MRDARMKQRKRLLSFVLASVTTTVFLSGVEAGTQAVPAKQQQGGIADEIDQLVEAVATAKDAQQRQAVLKTVPVLATKVADRSELLAVFVEYARQRNLSSEKTRAYVDVFKNADFTGEDKMRYAIPRLTDAAPSEKERLYALISTVPSEDGKWRDHRFDVSFLRSQSNNLYPSFIEHMYSVYPTSALPRLAEALIDDTGKKKLVLDASNIVQQFVNERLRSPVFSPDESTRTKVVSALKKLAEDDEWWVRYYAAKVIRNNRQYREPGLLRNLQADNHEVVRKMVAALSAE